MYTSYFNLKEIPFSIAPDPAFLYMSPRHQEALGHLLYGTGQYGGFVQLTGEVGTGKTTIIRTLLSQKLHNVDAAMIHNPRQSEQEFVQSICDELGVSYRRENLTLKTLVDALNTYLLAQHERGHRTVLIIDEAQQLKPDVLEQVRLLTNLETSKEKLLRIMLVGQPELAELLARNDLRQLAQRITARYHLTPLNASETGEYIAHRIKIAGRADNLFTPAAIKAVFRHTGGVPRLINVICDRALLGAYSRSAREVSAETVNAAAAEVFGQPIRAVNTEKALLPASPDEAVAPRPKPAGTRLRWLEIGLALATAVIPLSLVIRYWPQEHAGKPPASSMSAQPAGTNSAEPPPGPASTTSSVPPAASGSSAAIGPALSADKPAKLALAFGAETARAAAAPLNEQMLRLARLWQPGFKASSAERPCRTLHRARFECMKGSTEWSELVAMNVPVILTLSLGKNDVRYVLLRELTQNTATLVGANGAQKVLLRQLDPLWTGEYLLVWKRETDELSIGPDTRGEPVQWLRHRLAERLGTTVGNPDNGRWDTELKTAVQRFQTANGIKPDGVASARTLAVLASPIGAPRLRKNG